MSGKPIGDDRLLAALMAHATAGHTMPAVETLGAESGLSVATVFSALRRLVAAGKIECLVRGGGTRSGTWRIVASGAVLEGASVRGAYGAKSARREAPEGLKPPADDCKERKCLRCGGMFLSPHVGIRICLPCKSLNDFSPAADAYQISARVAF